MRKYLGLGSVKFFLQILLCNSSSSPATILRIITFVSRGRAYTDGPVPGSGRNLILVQVQDLSKLSCPRTPLPPKTSPAPAPAPIPPAKPQPDRLPGLITKPRLTLLSRNISGSHVDSTVTRRATSSRPLPPPRQQSQLILAPSHQPLPSSSPPQSERRHNPTHILHLAAPEPEARMRPGRHSNPLAAGL